MYCPGWDSTDAYPGGPVFLPALIQQTVVSGLPSATAMASPVVSPWQKTAPWRLSPLHGLTPFSFTCEVLATFFLGAPPTLTTAVVSRGRLPVWNLTSHGSSFFRLSSWSGCWFIRGSECSQTGNMNGFPLSFSFLSFFFFFFPEAKSWTTLKQIYNGPSGTGWCSQSILNAFMLLPSVVSLLRLPQLGLWSKLVPPHPCGFQIKSFLIVWNSIESWSFLRVIHPLHHA